MAELQKCRPLHALLRLHYKSVKNQPIHLRLNRKTGLSLDLLSQRAFGEKGSYLPSAMTSFTQIGWFGVGSFVSGGTATPNFARFAKNGKSGAITTVVAFFIGNSLMFFFGAVSSIFVGGNDIFEVMVRLNLFYLAVLVLGLNIWTTNDNALYTAGLGLANIFHQRKKPMVLLSGIIGTVASVWLYYNFCGWLNILVSFRFENCNYAELCIHYNANQKK